MGSLKLIFFILGVALIAFGSIINIQTGPLSGPNHVVFFSPRREEINIATLPANVVDTPTSTPKPTNTLPASAFMPFVYVRSTPVSVLGKHYVQPGEWLFCIGRAYGVSPWAIAESNFHNLNDKLTAGQPLLIPDVQWVDIPAGTACVPQFKSPYSSIAFPTITPAFTPVTNLKPYSELHTSSRKPNKNDGSLNPEDLKLVNFIPHRSEMQTMGLQAPAISLTPSPVPTNEARKISVDWPHDMLLDASDEVRLIFAVDKSQPAASESDPTSLTQTAVAVTEPPDNYSPCTRESNPSVTYSQSLTIPPEPESYKVFVIAHLDAVGFTYLPIDNEYMQQVNQGEALTWRWSIKPQNVGNQTLILSIRLHYEPVSSDTPALPDKQLWINSFCVNVRKKILVSLLGTQIDATGTVPIALGAISVGMTIGTNLFEFWEKRARKKSPLSEQSKQAEKQTEERKEAT